MARRYYGLPRASGFAEGFQGGFGLVQDYFDGKKKDRRYEEEQAYERQKYQDELNLKRDELAELKRQRKFEEDFRSTAQGIVSKQADTDAVKAATESADSAENREVSELTRREREFNLTRQEEQADEIKDNRTNNEMLVAAAKDVSELFNYFATSTTDGSYDPAEGLRLLKKVEASGVTAGGAAGIDFEAQFSPSVTGAIKQFGVQLERMRNGEDVDVNALLDMANLALLRGNNQMGVGATIGEDTHPNAPARVQDGNWKVKSKRIAEIIPTNQVGEDGDATYKLTVDVIAVDANGREFVYNAPLTMSRSGESEEVVLSTKDLFEAGAGIASFNRSANAYKAFARQARIRSDRLFQDDTQKFDENKYTAWLGQEIANWKRETQNAGSAPSVVPGMTNSELAGNSEALQDYFLTKRYNPQALLPRAENNQVDQVLEKIRSVPEISAIENQLKGKLTRAQLLEAQQFLQKGRDDQLIIDKDDKKAFHEFRNRITGRTTAAAIENLQGVTGRSPGGVWLGAGGI